CGRSTSRPRGRWTPDSNACVRQRDGEVSITRTALGLLLAVGPLAAQTTPLDAFRGNIAAIHSRNRAAYLSHYLHTPALARVGPDGLRQGYDSFAAGVGASWPDTLIAAQFRIVPVTP